MRIATWNLERGGRTRAAALAQPEIIRAVAADILVVTEPPASYRSGPGVLTSPPRRNGPKDAESWVAIVGASLEPVELDIPFERTTAAARATLGGREVLIYVPVRAWT